MGICNLVLCPPRSGSSCIAGCLYYSGFDFGKHLVIQPDRLNPKGYFENRPLYKFNVRSLASQDSDRRGGGILGCEVLQLPGSVDELRKIAAEQFGKGPIVIKDPRIYRLGDVYFDAFADWDICIVHVLRELEPTLASMRRMFRKVSTDELRRVYHFYHEGISKLAEKWPYHVIRFEDVLDSFKPVRELVEFCGLDPDCVDEEKLAPFLSEWPLNPYRAHAPQNYTLKQARARVGGRINIGQKLLDALLARGLTNDSRVLEVGPGCFRCSARLIGFLNKGNYFCIEGDEGLLEIGLEKRLGDLVERVDSVTGWDFDVSAFGGERFDFIVAQGVVCHMPAVEFLKLLQMVAKRLAFRGEFWFSFIEGERNNRNPFEWSIEDIAQFCRDSYLDFEYLGAWGHPRGLAQGVVRHRMVAHSPWRSPVAVVSAIRDLISGRRVCDLGCAEGDLLLVMSQYADSVVGIENAGRRRRSAVARGLDVWNASYRGDLPEADVYYCWPNASADLSMLAEKISRSATMIFAADSKREEEMGDLAALKERFGGEVRTVKYNEGRRPRQHGVFLLLVINGDLLDV